MKSSKSPSLKKLKEMFGITFPKTSAQRQRMITAARKALITPHISSTPSGDVVFNPSREDLLRIVNPTYTDRDVREIQGKLADAEMRLPNDPTKVSLNTHILDATLRMPAISRAIQSNLFFPRTTDLTPLRDISAREYSRALFGDFSDPATWSKKTPIVFSDTPFQTHPPQLRAFFNPGVLSALAQSGSAHLPPDQAIRSRGLPHGPKGVIFARASRTQPTPEFARVISSYPEDSRREVEREYYGKSPLETLMMAGRIHSDVAHELGHVPIAKPDDYEMLKKKEQQGTITRDEARRLDRSVLGDYSSRVVTPAFGSQFDTQYNRAAYPYQPGEWSAELRGAITGVRGKGLVGHFQDAHIDAINAFVRRRNPNAVEGMYLPGREIVEFDPSMSPHAGDLSYPVDFDPSIPISIRRHILPHLHDNFNAKNLDSSERICLINEAIEKLRK